MGFSAVGKLVNLTPHEITIHTWGAAQVVLPPSGSVARCAEERDHAFLLDVDGIAVEATRAHYGAITGLPEPEPGVYYIVSAMVAQAAKRGDVLCPGPAIRDEAGRIVSCEGLSVCN